MSSKLWDLIKACHPRPVRLLVHPPKEKELYLECMEINAACLNYDAALKFEKYFEISCCVWK
jgi:hypothetical protein